MLWGDNTPIPATSGSLVFSRRLGYGKRTVADFEANLRAVLATLEGCHASLVLHGDSNTARLVSVAILELRTRLNGIEALELKALCDVMVLEAEAAPGATSRPFQPKAQAGLRSPVALKLVK
jgi:hypothetical protein